jgi:transposase
MIVEYNEVYIVTEHKGITKAIKNRDPRRNRLEERRYFHKTVNHSQCEYARDEDVSSFHEVHVNTMKGLWSLLRSRLCPHHGISPEKLPLYLGFFEFIHHVRKHGQAL